MTDLKKLKELEEKRKKQLAEIKRLEKERELRKRNEFGRDIASSEVYPGDADPDLGDMLASTTGKRLRELK